MKKNAPQTSVNIAAYLLAALALAIHFYVLLRYSSNTPKGDDYWDVFRFLSNYINATSWQEKLSLVYAQHNEHRTLVNRVIYLFFYEMSGKIDFKLLILIGDLSTVGITILLALQIKDRRDFLFILSLFAIFLLNLQSWFSMFLAMTAISNYCVVFFALASLYALTNKSKGQFAISIIFAALSMFSQGNGIAIWPIGFACIYLEQDKDRSRHLLIWSCAALVFLGLYFYHYTPSQTLSLTHNTAQGLTAVVRFAIWFFTFIGSCWAFESNSVPIAAGAGAIMLIMTIFALKFFKREAPVLTYFILFVLCSSAIATYSRFAIYDVPGALTSRYRIYSVYLSGVLLAFTYLWLSGKNLPKKLLKIGALLIALTHTTASYAASFEMMRIAQRDFGDSLRLWLLTAQPKRFAGSAYIKDAGYWTDRAIAAAIWDPRDIFSDALYFYRQQDLSSCAMANFKSDLLMSIARNPAASIGELIVDDTPLARKRITRVIVCKDKAAYLGDSHERARTLNGSLQFHFLKNTPVETADSIIFISSTGDMYKGVSSLSSAR